MKRDHYIESVLKTSTHYSSLRNLSFQFYLIKAGSILDGKKFPIKRDNSSKISKSQYLI